MRQPQDTELPRIGSAQTGNQERASSPDRWGSFAAAVLAGGKSLRWGGLEKSLIPVQGIPLIRRTLDLLGGIFSQIILVTNQVQVLAPHLGAYQAGGGPDRRGRQKSNAAVLLTPDIIGGVGPLGGIHAALARTDREAVFVVACDMPFLDPGLIRRQLGRFREEGGDVLIPRIQTACGVLLEPLHGVYGRHLREPLGQFLGARRSFAIRDFLDTRRTHYLDLPDTDRVRNVFINLNTPRDLGKAARIDRSH